MNIDWERTIGAALMAGIIFSLPGLLYVWFKYGTCNWGRHNYGKWGEAYKVSYGNSGTKRQDRVCKTCGAETHRHINTFM